MGKGVSHHLRGANSPLGCDKKLFPKDNYLWVYNDFSIIFWLLFCTVWNDWTFGKKVLDEMEKRII